MTLCHHYGSINLALIPGSGPLQMCTTLRNKILHKQLQLCNQKMRSVACPVHQNAFRSMTCMISWMWDDASIIIIKMD